MLVKGVVVGNFYRPLDGEAYKRTPYNEDL